MYTVEEIDLTAAAWDAAIRPYRTKLLFHQSFWLSHLERTQSGQRMLLAIRDGNHHVGYFCGVLIRKGPLRILGSPLRGWWTPLMGPVVDGCDPRALLAAFDQFCRAQAIDYVELCTPFFQSAALLDSAYVPDHDISYLLQIRSPNEMWQRLKSNARNHIRQAEKNGIHVEVSTDISMVDEYYQQLKADFARKYLTPAHSCEMVRNLWRELKDAGNLLALSAVHQGRCIATFLGAFDERFVYGLGWTSWPDAYALRPNELIQWSVMTFAAERRIPLYDMCGAGDFKAKFGAELVPRVRWHKAITSRARLGYQLYRACWFGRRELLRQVRQLIAHGPSPHMTGVRSIGKAAAGAPRLTAELKIKPGRVLS